MRRSLLVSISLVGLVICLVGGTGLFAALQDDARTGVNSATSRGLAGSADIQIALGDAQSPTGCATFTENLAVGLFAITNWDVSNTENKDICLRNVGSQLVSVGAFSESVVDLDDDCTGDEAAVGDTTCGNGQLGELSGNIDLFFSDITCGTQTITGFNTSGSLTSSINQPIPLPDLAVGETRCVKIFVQYRTTASATDRQMAQSDTATWIFRFSARVP
jgi:hypothetical protein